jgi:uncharacterized membrane protein YfcA
VSGELSKVILFFGAGFASAVLNTLASSGSAVTLPLLVFMGLPPNVANGTNRVQLMLGRITNIIAFQRAGVINWRLALFFVVPGLLGSLVGATIAAEMAPRAITFAIIAAFVMLITNPKRLLKKAPEVNPPIRWWHLTLYFLVGIWGGFIVLDTSTYALLVLVLAVGLDLKEANVTKAVASLAMATASLTIFTYAHEVDWYFGTLLALGSIAGSWVGAYLAIQEWIKIWIYRLLLLIIGVEIYQLGMKYFLG